MLNDSDKIKEQFPIFKRKIRDGKGLVYLDNAATSQKPQVVIDAIVDYYSNHNANIHRGIHTLAEEATEAYENVRLQVQQFLSARLPSEIIFTKSTTEAINLVAYAWGRSNLKEGDEILLTEMEHHANLIPWQMLAEEKGVTLRFIPVDEQGFLDVRNLKGLLTEKTRMVALVHASNFLGTINDLEEITKLAKERGARVLIDAAQSVPHLPVNVQKLRADFLAFSAHKMLGPMGVGVLYVRGEVYDETGSFLTGGGMVKVVDWERTTFTEPPRKYEAGTPNVAGVVGLGAAINFLQSLDFTGLLSREQELASYLMSRLEEIGGVRIYGPRDVNKRLGVVSFTVENIHSHDLASILDEQGVAIRSGHHCVQPLHRKLGITDSARASLYLYNTKEDVEALIDGILLAKKILI